MLNEAVHNLLCTIKTALIAVELLQLLASRGV